MVDLTKNNFGYLDSNTKKPKEEKKEEVKKDKKEECKKEDKKCCDVITDFCLPFVCSIEGFKTCVKGFHWESSNYNVFSIIYSQKLIRVQHFARA